MPSKKDVEAYMRRIKMRDSPNSSGILITIGGMQNKTPINVKCQSCGAPRPTSVKNLKDGLRCEYCGSCNDIIWEY